MYFVIIVADIVGGDGTEVVEGSDGGQPRRGNFFATFMQRLRQKKQRIMERKRGIFAEKFDKIRQKFQRSEEPVEQEEPAEDEVNDEH